MVRQIRDFSLQRVPASTTTDHPRRTGPYGLVRQLGDNGTIFSAGTGAAEQLSAARAAWLSASINQGGPSSVLVLPKGST